ncbi:MAG: hypothetical protein SFY96_08580 [Planctomycetota bacterium]|nr:hypothetical protein [Planctomycetota bacterium]
MTLRERLSALNRLQQTTTFKVIASCVVIALAITVFGVHLVRTNSVNAPQTSSQTSGRSSTSSAPASDAQTPPADAATPEVAGAAVGTEAERAAQAEAERAARSNFEAATRAMETIISARGSSAQVGLSVLAVTGIALGAIWLGLGLTYLGLVVLSICIIWPMTFVPSLRGAARLLGGGVALTAAFTVIMAAMRLLLSAPGAMFAVARNVLAEATRMKMTLIFIVMLIFMLAALPGLMDPDSPLRYRVQSFLQWGTGGSFWIIAILTLVFSVSTVAFEQRDKIIWQTITKPVAHWQYLLGKWIGVMAVNFALLSVSGTGVYIFTEYLSGQRAMGEIEGVRNDQQVMSEDRIILHTQVLVARRTIEASPPKLDQKIFEQNVTARIEAEKSNPNFVLTEEVRAKLREELLKATIREYRSVPPAQAQVFRFEGLQAAREAGLPLTLRYKIDAGSNRPDLPYRVSLLFPNDGSRAVRETALGQTHSLPVLSSAIDADGNMDVEFANGDVQRGLANPETMNFPPGGLEVSYVVSGYGTNFLRVMIVLWVKLGFLAMLGIAGATFLSFPVASLVAFTTFLSAEGAKFLADSLEQFDSTTASGGFHIIKTPIAWIGNAVAGLFSVYSELRPTQRLVDGLLMDWSSVSTGSAVLLLWTALLFVAAVLIFRRRELAIYSGN